MSQWGEAADEDRGRPEPKAAKKAAKKAKKALDKLIAHANLVRAAAGRSGGGGGGDGEHDVVGLAAADYKQLAVVAHATKRRAGRFAEASHAAAAAALAATAAAPAAATDEAVAAAEAAAEAAAALFAVAQQFEGCAAWSPRAAQHASLAAADAADAAAAAASVAADAERRDAYRASLAAGSRAAEAAAAPPPITAATASGRGLSPGPHGGGGDEDEAYAGSLADAAAAGPSDDYAARSLAWAAQADAPSLPPFEPPPYPLPRGGVQGTLEAAQQALFKGQRVGSAKSGEPQFDECPYAAR
jgi:hypothetical protein